MDITGLGWKARFVCWVAISTPDGTVRTTEGNCAGVIIPEERGNNGFGFDPLFYMPEREKTMAQLGEDEKNRISHRARAVMAAQPILMLLAVSGGKLI
jgi:XTP/dITP diphosphohydrolase